MQQHVPHLDESISASPALSPGPVQDQENLLRIIIEPDHISEGRIQPSAVQLRGLTQRVLPVHCRAYTNEQEIRTAAQALADRTTAAGRRRLEGLASFTAGAVRDITNLERQAFLVIDTALPDNMAHASMYLASPQVSQSLAREMKEQLLRLMDHRLTLEQAFAHR